MSAWSRPLTAPEATLVHHPDQRTPWAPSIVVHLRPGSLDRARAEQRLADLVVTHPILRARLGRDRRHWIAGPAPHVELLTDGAVPLLRTRLELQAGPPVRVALAPDAGTLVIVAHHAALDGRALLMIAAGLLGAPDVAKPRPDVQPRDGNHRAAATPAAPHAATPAAALRRLVAPADRVAPSGVPPAQESFVWAEPPEGVRLRAATIAAAAVQAATQWNRDRGAPWRRVGLTIPVGGPPVLGNVSTHRRIDLAAGMPVAEAVAAALAAAEPPPDAAITPGRARALALLAPLVDRLSDSLLVSNLGVVDLPGAMAVDFSPQARGRSAVAIGACTPRGGTPRLTVRARDLSPSDAQQFLALVSDALVAA